MAQSVATPLPSSSFAVYGTKSVATVLADGDLLVEGYAAVWDGLDRESENFEPGAFTRGIKAFLSGQAGLCYHHKHDKLMGKVLDLREDDKGLWIRARVDGAIRLHPELRAYYEQVKKGSLNALSVGGFFKRKLTAAGQKIVDMDFTEVSMTPVPVHPGTRFAVVGGKAMDLQASLDHRLTVSQLRAAAHTLGDMRREVDRARVDRFLRDAS